MSSHWKPQATVLIAASVISAVVSAGVSLLTHRVLLPKSPPPGGSASPADDPRSAAESRRERSGQDAIERTRSAPPPSATVDPSPPAIPAEDWTELAAAWQASGAARSASTCLRRIAGAPSKIIVEVEIRPPRRITELKPESTNEPIPQEVVDCIGRALREGDAPSVKSPMRVVLTLGS